MDIGSEVVARPGYGLTATELGILLLRGDGESPTAIQAATGLNSTGLHMAERDIRRKLGARTPEHMISRAFQLGILSSRALCLLLAILSADYSDAMKNRSPIRGGRPGVTMVRIKLAGRNMTC